MSYRPNVADDEVCLARFRSDRLKFVSPDLQIFAIVGNGDDAAKSIEALEPDVAFLDIYMPRIKDFEVTRGVEG